MFLSRFAGPSVSKTRLLTEKVWDDRCAPTGPYLRGVYGFKPSRNYDGKNF